MEELPGWWNASAIVLSCPGPLRRHVAALVPVYEATLPQVLLGGESQLLAFAASGVAAGLQQRLFFAPFPEMFPDAASLRAAWRRAGGAGRGEAGRGEAGRGEAGRGRRPGEGPGRLVHLRFGGVRAARVLKGVRNACVVAEAGGTAPLTPSHHPFASGLVLPASIRRLFVYGPDCQRPRTIGGGALPVSRLPASCVTADLEAAQAVGAEAGAGGGDSGLDLVSLAEFRSFAWAAGPVRARGARAQLVSGDGATVLLPWNMDHPGSIVPALLERLARLHAGEDGRPEPGRMPRIVLLPFNYVGQTGIIRRLITRLRAAAHDPDALLGDLFLARIGTLAALGPLRRLASFAWVDGNDPEHWWTLARFGACGIDTILIDPAATGQAAPASGLRLHADEAVWVEAETRCGTLTFHARLPSLRTLPRLLAMSAPEPAPAAATAGSGRARRPARLARAWAASATS